MKKTLFALMALAACFANADSVIYDNGPMVTHAGQGAGGADLSMCSADPNTAGLNRKFFGPDAEYFTIADNFTLTANANLTKMVFYGYQTGANTPTWTAITAQLWSGQPGAGGAIIATATSVTFAQTNIFRCFNGVFVDTARKINAITANFPSTALTAGTGYWVSCQITTGGASGWANMVMDPNPANPNDPITRAGNGLQYRQDPVTLLYGWLPAVSGTVNIVQSEFPFLVYGDPATSTERLAPNGEVILLGQASGGNLASYAGDDNDARNICKFFVPNAASPFIRVNLNYTTTKTNPTAIDFVVKVGVHTPGPQSITLYVQDKTNSNFVVTNVNGAASLNGTVYTGAAAAPLARYVGGGGAMTGQIEIRQTGPSTALLPCSSFEVANMLVTG